MKRIMSWAPLLLVSLLAQGCSVYLAASQPPKVDLAPFEIKGMNRDMVVATLGPPVSSVKHEDGTRTDMYQFYKGSETGWKVGRAAFHIVADFFTLALWEIVATPTELLIKGDKVSAHAAFDKHEVLHEFKVAGAP